METSTLTLINLIREQGLKPGKGHLLPTEHPHQSIYFNQRTNTRVIIESKKETISLWLIPQNIVIPTENLIEKFEEYSFNINFISDADFKRFINKIDSEAFEKIITTPG
ncbi:hypothetical protein ERHA55_29450 [Erwinia rhapontici]|uniref:Uncharacterized protein n=1 Tax=Erwinia rhapontici TaxID=55212 RepID=A0ABM7N1I4_ERWRD|nr:hypothetical protein [Erwinia rhapontici]BCQ35274.1 hypothetical protein ERHA53_26170 [Erwinia rhapontici]BCQ45418.1 hypothetical protein ERHA55_29450 [Erwinia rhapontici]